MIKALVDPSFLTPPAQGSCLPWLRSLRLWSQALREIDAEAIRPILSLDAQAGLATAGSRSMIQSALDRSDSPLGASDVIQLVENIRGRTSTPSEAFEPSEIAFNDLRVEPDYIDSGSDALVDPFRHDLGHGAAFQQETTSHVTAITTATAWTRPADQVSVAGDVEVWEKFGVVEEPVAELSTVSETIDLWHEPRAADTTLSNCWVDLIDHPQLGIEVAYRGFTAEDEESKTPLNFEIGSQFVGTMKQVGYGRKSGRIKAVFQAAAYIGCQRGGELNSLGPHPYRKSSGPTGPAVEREDGVKLMRGSLGTGRNANRLMWWDGPVPVILGVVGHDDDPLFLT